MKKIIFCLTTALLLLAAYAAHKRITLSRANLRVLIDEESPCSRRVQNKAGSDLVPIP